MDLIERHSLKFAEEFHSLSEGDLQANLVAQYVNDAHHSNNIAHVDWPSSSSWINSNALNQELINGKVVLLDFFTYCCINCIHMIPFVHKIETSYSEKDGLIIIGVHSAKFINEKNVNNIINALNRYNITHPVLNDSNLELWNGLSIKCWPTFVILNPQGKVLLSLPGEAHADVVEAVLSEAMNYYKQQLNHASILKNEENQRESIPNSPGIKYPGKVAIDMSGTLLAIADTGNHRVIICSVDGHVKHMVGGCEAGSKDGDFNACRFNSPQGLAWHRSTSVYVADCNNHRIRKIDLNVFRVVTVAGNGKHGSDVVGGKLGTDQDICSPWDVAIGGSPRFPQSQNILYIAMAGLHQIWAFFLQDADWQRGSEYKMGTCLRFAGNSQEENRNNSYPHKAGFAQPSGLSVDVEAHRLYVADSESSTVRRVNLATGAVEGLVGGGFDPTDLFAFGDEDGKARNAKLQHPLSVAWDRKRDRLYIADSYNHKIKVVDPVTKRCSALCGPDECEMSSHDKEGYPASFPAVELDEPGGVCVDQECEHLFIADTNNHAVKVVSLSDGVVSELDIKFDKEKHSTVTDSITIGKKVSAVTRLVDRKRAQFLSLDPFRVGANATVQLKFVVPDLHLSADAPSSWQLSAAVDSETSVENAMLINSGRFRLPTATLNVSLLISELLNLLITPRLAFGDDCSLTGEIAIYLTWEASLYFCVDDSGLCSMKEVISSIPLIVNTKPAQDSHIESLTVDVVFP